MEIFIRLVEHCLWIPQQLWFILKNGFKARHIKVPKGKFFCHRFLQVSLLTTTVNVSGTRFNLQPKLSGPPSGSRPTPGCVEIFRAPSGDIAHVALGPPGETNVTTALILSFPVSRPDVSTAPTSTPPV